jgi:hypothetical protein
LPSAFSPKETIKGIKVYGKSVARRAFISIEKSTSTNSCP